MKDIYDALTKYSKEGFVPLHMPGHKRNSDLFVMENPYLIDITEIDGFDNLHNPQGILLKSMKKASELYHSQHTYYLVNGSSAGILASICGITKKGDKVLVARNCHKSVYNAIYLNELNPIYIYSQDYSELKGELGIYGGISARDVENRLVEHKDISAVIVTSPTYEGVVSDIKRISEITHQYNIPLIVDEAHGAHFMFSEEFPESALALGADMVIHSIHKTLPAFTQSALLHIGEGRLDRESIKAIEHYLDIYQSTSPSYILLAGIDRCINWLIENEKESFAFYVLELKKLRQEIKKLNYINLLETDDITKIILYADRDNCSLNGKQLYDILLNKYHIQLEMASENYVIAMTSVADKIDYYDSFLEALRDLDKNEALIGGCVKGRFQYNAGNTNTIKAAVEMNIYHAVNTPGWEVDLQDSEGYVSGTCICVYPPGVPIVNPGERITKDIIIAIVQSLNTGLQVMGLSEYGGKEVRIKCLK